MHIEIAIVETRRELRRRMPGTVWTYVYLYISR